MTQRLQTINDDTVLEITESQPVKTRLSEKTLLRNKAYLEASIANFQLSLDKVNADLAKIQNAKNTA